MAKYILPFLIIGLFKLSGFAAIKNGYEFKIDEVRSALENLSKIQTKKIYGISISDDSQFHDKKLGGNPKIDSLKRFILRYEQTEKLLNEFRTIAPELYNEIDTIKNAHGVVTDVYVKLLPDEHMIKSQKGRVEMGQCGRDGTTCYSEYGIHTISITIYTEIQPLFIMAHEFGHVKYQVPHLVSYMKYYKKTYQDRSYDGYFLGHYPKDPGGKSALEYEARFRNSYERYNRDHSL